MIVRESLLDLSRNIYLKRYHLFLHVCGSGFFVVIVNEVEPVGKIKKNSRAGHWIVVVTLWTFFLAAALDLVAQVAFNRIPSLIVSFVVLLSVICLGIAFDLIGTAAAAASTAPLNAKAALKIPGARRGVYLVQHAEQVANFCNDVVGDISGVISGTLSALIVLRLANRLPLARVEIFVSIFATALVAAITVGGKAWGKTYALRKSTEILVFVGKTLNRLETVVGFLKRRNKEHRR